MNNGKGKVIIALIGIIQALVIGLVFYWVGRVDANTQSTSQNAVQIGKIEGQLEAISKQLDRIEIHITAEDHKGGN